MVSGRAQKSKGKKELKKNLNLYIAEKSTIYAKTPHFSGFSKDLYVPLNIRKNV